MDVEAGSSPSDEELMSRLQDGDDSALGPLMQHWELSVRRFLFRIVGNAAEAEDLAQEALDLSEGGTVFDVVLFHCDQPGQEPSALVAAAPDRFAWCVDRRRGRLCRRFPRRRTGTDRCGAAGTDCGHPVRRRLPAGRYAHGACAF
jgi:hypothetical protein